MKPLVVAIDGPAGAGKSTVSRRLAQALAYRYIDTGAMYRVIGVLAAEQRIDVTNDAALAALCDHTKIEFVESDGRVCTLVDGRDMSDIIRTPEAAQLASKTSTVPVVRERLVAMQRSMGASGGVVMEGRDIGTVVFPNAPVKVFLDASPRERAWRRASEMHDKVGDEELERMTREIAERDARDRGRAHSPLRPAEDALLLDTTKMKLDEVVRTLLEHIATRAAALESHS
ncbi:MAG: (d)CMP kinase [Deltaproteobacteria bacterium]|nr:(d)CMP kinase [Deltaproteobacteria bacterium]